MQQIEIDRTDEEREELVKKWIGDYWLWIVMAVMLSIGAVYGINYYKQSKINAMSTLAAELNEVQQNLKDGKVESAVKHVTNLQGAEAISSFTSIATLSLGEYYFKSKHFNKAASQYAWLVTSADDSAMRDIARLRQARALAENKKIAEAITALSAIESNNNVSEANLLKGDILFSDNQLDKAKAVYTLLKDNKKMDEQVIEQRLNLLNIKQQLNHEKTE